MAGRKQTATMELAIGATIIAGVIILIVMLMAWGNSTSILGSHYRIVVNMTNVGGLKEGAPVKLGGFQIGRVASIKIRPGSTEMEIVLDVDENYLLPKDSTAKVSTAGLVGDAFMEIIPGKSAETIVKSDTVAGAERLESSPLPDLSELFVKVNAFGDQLTILTANLNDVVGDAQFRKSVKSLAVNMDAVSYQANLILQRGQKVIDNLELASDTIRQSVAEITTDVKKVTGSAIEIADTAKEAITTAKDALSTAKDTVGTVKEAVEQAKVTVDHATKTIDNIDGGVSEARQAIASTIGNPRFAEDFTQLIANARTFTGGLADRRDSIDSLVVNLDALSGDLRVISGHVKEILGGIDPASVPTALGSMTTALNSMSEVVEKIKQEPVLALSINKAADRIVKAKFDEMSRQQIKTSDQMLSEINRWVRESMQRSYMVDPKYEYSKRPYVMDK